MENRYAQDYIVPPSVCDSSGQLGIPDAFALFMDLATAHAAQLGFDTPTLMKRGLFWLAVRTRVRFLRRPAMTERVTLSTWPCRPGRLRADRDYRIERDGELLISGRTEWTILELDTGRLHPTVGLFPPDFAFCSDSVWDEPFSRVKDEPLDEFARYTVRSTDVDLGGHMNNVAYLRALAGFFSCKDWQRMDVRELEIAYRSPCYEGDTLIWQRRDNGDTIQLRAALSDGKTIAQARIVKR